MVLCGCNTVEDTGCIIKIVTKIIDNKLTTGIFFISFKSPYFLRNVGIYNILDGIHDLCRILCFKKTNDL